MTEPEQFWTVEVCTAPPFWTEWTSWVDRATAEAEKSDAREQGYHLVRIRRSP